MKPPQPADTVAGINSITPRKKDEGKGKSTNGGKGKTAQGPVAGPSGVEAQDEDPG